uniref:glucose-6-phosphate 1-epimerase n=2 Tax=Kalanchoe fedtschenkoi TaxID=63787 RepID=A0A7N0VGE3_KALFE
MHAIADYVLLLIAGVRSLLMSLCSGNNSSRGYRCVSLSEPGGSTVEILLYGGQIVSWKNGCGDELLYLSSKPMTKSSKISSGGITVCFEQKFQQSDMARQHGHLRNKLWSTWPPSSQRVDPCWVDLIYLSTQEDMQIWPHRFELRVRVILSAGRLKLFPHVRNIDTVPFSFTLSLRNYFTVSDISEVRIEGLETLDYIDNKLHRRRATEQADALTFDEEIDRSYLNTPNKLVIIDHGKKRTYVLTKGGLPDAGYFNVNI